METIRFGVVGIKGRGGKLAQEVEAIEEASLAAVADLDEDAAEAVASDSGASVYTDYEKMISEAELDAAIVATPHQFHASMGVACLEAGLHTFLEKPIANTVSEADRLVDAASSRSLVLGIGHNYRTFPGNIAMKELVEEIAPVHRVFWQWLDTRQESYYDRDVWRCTWEGAGGGVLMNQTSHDLDLLCWMIGQPVEVSAMIGNWGHRAEIEDTAIANIRFASGAAANVQFGMCDRSLNYRQVAGDGGAVELRHERNSNVTVPDQLRIATYGTPMRAFIEGSDGDTSTPNVSWRDVAVQGKAGFGPIIPDFVSAIREGRDPVTSGASARVTLELINGIILSSFEKRAVTLPVDRAAYDDLFDALKSGSTVVERW